MDTTTNDADMQELNSLVSQYEDEMSELHDLQQALYQLAGVIKESHDLTEARSTLDSMME